MTLFVITNFELTQTPTGHTLHIETDLPVELFLHTQPVPPAKRQKHKTVRGLDIACGWLYIWSPSACLPPAVLGPHLAHDFTIDQLPVGAALSAVLVESDTCTFPNPSGPPFDIPPIKPTFTAHWELSANAHLLPGTADVIGNLELISATDPSHWLDITHLYYPLRHGVFWELTRPEQVNVQATIQAAIQVSSSAYAFLSFANAASYSFFQQGTDWVGAGQHLLNGTNSGTTMPPYPYPDTAFWNIVVFTTPTFDVLTAIGPNKTQVDLTYSFN